MKALGYLLAHQINDFSISEFNIPEPQLNEYDVLVRIKAISINPVDYKIRQNRSSQENNPVILGWDASGVIEKVGSLVDKFKIGDEVYYAGDLNRDGSYAELQAVDARIIAHKPKTLTFTQAAAIPLTAITAYETLILQTTTAYNPNSKVLIIGGAGGVGSLGIQLLKTLTPSQVIATASREVSKEWCLKVGADHVLNHKNDLALESKKIGINEFDFIFSTNSSESYLPLIPSLLKPFGHYALIDDPKSLDIKPFKTKSIRVSWEFMFSKTMFGFDLESQGKLLTHISYLIDSGKIKTTLNLELNGLNPQNIKEAHSVLESGTSVGKIVISI